MKRHLFDILDDVVEALEPKETLPAGEAMASLSPLGLWVYDVWGCQIQWFVRSDVDTGTLIDVAPSAGLQVGVSGDGNAFVYRGGRDIVGRAASESTREAVILALAGALGVETEEEQ